MRLFGLIGFPLAQSFSKKYFEEKFREEGLTDCRFENFAIPTINDLSSLLQQHADLHGLAVTIPYKQAVMTFLNEVKIPAGLQACNCIRIANGKLTGYNTDYIGFEKSFTPLLSSHHTHALVLGNGGATSAVIYVLKKLNITYEIVSRKLHNDSTLTYGDIDAGIMSSHTIIINTTPLGMYPNLDECPPIPYDEIGDRHLLYDLVYNPGMTTFLQKGEEQGAKVKNGGDMLYLQAEENWKIWNDLKTAG